MNSFRHLADNKFIVCLTKGPGSDAEIQATFNHTIFKKSFTDIEPTCLALTGFGPRASAVKLTLKKIFKQSSKIKIPKFGKLIKCKSADEIRALPREIEKKVDNYAILPPFLTQELFGDEDFSPMNVLVRLTTRAHKLIKIPKTISVESDIELDEEQGKEEVFEGFEEDGQEFGPNDPNMIEVDELGR